MFAGNLDGATDFLRHNPVTAVVADPLFLLPLQLKCADGIRMVAVFNGSEPPPGAVPASAARVCIRATDARQALQRAIAPCAGAGCPVPALGRLIGSSTAMNQVFECIRQVAASDNNVLIQGETGTGKDLAARAVHDTSTRRRRPFVVYDCAAFPPDLMEASLFGHRRGAFTGAHNDHRGYLEAANGGTIFLDDIDNLDPSRQAKLLRILQDKQFQRLGSDRVIRVDVRFVAATNRNLAEMLDCGALRQDLYYRLNVLPVHMPPLRQRGDDVALLTDYFTAQLSERTGIRPKPVSADARRLLAAYPWPGNVRQLRNIVVRLQTFCETAVIDAAAIGSVLALDLSTAPIGPIHRETRAFQDRLIRRVLDQTGGNRTRAATLLGIHRNTLRAKMAAAGFAKPRGLSPPGD